MTRLYPHLTAELDTEFLYKDLVQRYISTRDNSVQSQVRLEIKQRHQDHSTWLVQHGYECGRDYQQTDQGFRFSSDALVTAFVLGNQP